MEESIFMLKNYGTIKINLKEILENRQISRNKLCNMIGANYDLITRYYNNSISRVDLDIISRICFVLNCNVDDIIVYERSDNNF